jgi:hypothetical protein
VIANRFSFCNPHCNHAAARSFVSATPGKLGHPASAYHFALHHIDGMFEPRMADRSGMRQFIRHPVDIPIEVSRATEFAGARSYNVSLGGLALRCGAELEVGGIVQLRIPFVQPLFETKARIVWCRECEAGFELGVEFLDADDAFRARMVEQVCAIESYKKTVSQTEGRSLSTDEAAMEWIAKYASQFPDPGREDLR